MTILELHLTALKTAMVGRDRPTSRVAVDRTIDLMDDIARMDVSLAPMPPALLTEGRA